MLFDTHCHIHEAEYSLDAGEVITRAHAAGVGQMICVGTSEASSEAAVAFSLRHKNVYASVGVHPHDTKEGYAKVVDMLSKELASQIVAVGEIGLDYFYTHSPREVQIAALEAQIDAALRAELPIIFHVREAFDDFWPIFDNFPAIRGELHSFTDSVDNLNKALERNMYIGVNGISTFTKDPAQKDMFASIPIARLLLETDAPFLTPVPFRGKVNEPAFVRSVAEHHASIRGVAFDTIQEATSANAHTLFLRK